jgi:hypothetical protein
MAFWQKLWLLFTVIWVVVAVLNVFAILAFGEETDPSRALRPLLLAFAVPAVAYLLGWLWSRWRSRGQGKYPDSFP